MPQLPAANTSSPQSGFTPRKEFIREQKPPPNSFALLTVAGSAFIRLYSFPIQVIDAFRHLLEHNGILLAFRENPPQNLYEFSLDGKPWANAKSVATEKLLIDLVAIVYQCGFIYLSALDYGREHDDRLVMAFSKPDIPCAPSRSGTPLPAPGLHGSGSQSWEKSRSKQIPFALSFASSTTMRVIAPPLNLTPAILQAVRNSWPRGVVSEKKVGDNSFEFKLKGYKWFQQDTFPTDSLSHILTLLSSLDAQSYTLLSSISLTNHSRVRDLWIFMGPRLVEDSSSQDSPASSIIDSSQGELKRQVYSPDQLARSQTGVHPNSPSHRRFATDHEVYHSPSSPANDDAQNTEHRHRNDPRAASPTSAASSAGLRNRSPRARLSTPVDQRAEKPYEGGLRVILPSAISSDVENMTGVGAGTGRFSPNIFYTASPHSGVDAAKPISTDQPFSAHRSPRSRSVTPSHPPHSLQPGFTRSKTPPLLVPYSSSPSRSPPRGIPNSVPEEQGDDTDIPRATAGSGGETPLLGGGAFRDSAFSSSSRATCYVSIKGHDKNGERDEADPERSRSLVDHQVSSSGPSYTGGWQPTPAKEQLDGGMNDGQTPADGPYTQGGPNTPIQEVSSRVSSPELNRPDSTLRKSEAAVMGVLVPPVVSPPPVPRLGRDMRKDSSSSGTGQGWVLVNFDGMSPATPIEMSPTRETHVVSKPPEPISSTSPAGNGLNKGEVSRLAEAQATVIVDPMNVGKKSKLKSKSTVVGVDESPPKTSFFGSSGKHSRLRKSSPLPTSVPTVRHEKEDGRKVQSRPGFRDKLRLIGTPEASRNDSRRRSID